MWFKKGSGKIRWWWLGESQVKVKSRKFSELNIALLWNLCKLKLKPDFDRRVTEICLHELLLSLEAGLQWGDQLSSLHEGIQRNPILSLNICHLSSQVNSRLVTNDLFCIQDNQLLDNDDPCLTMTLRSRYKLNLKCRYFIMFIEGALKWLPLFQLSETEDF